MLKITESNDMFDGDKTELRAWAKQVGYHVEEYVLATQGTRGCAVCGEPLACGSEGIGEFVLTQDNPSMFEGPEKGEHFIAHAQCGLDVHAELA